MSSRKAKIESYLEIIDRVQGEILNYHPINEEQRRDYNHQIKKIEDYKKEINKLTYTKEELKYQSRVNEISYSDIVIRDLEFSIKSMTPPSTQKVADDRDNKIRILNDYKRIKELQQTAIDIEYRRRPLQINVRDFDKNYCLVSFEYGSDTQRKAINEIFELRTLPDSRDNKELQEKGLYVTSSLNNDNGIEYINLPKDIAFEVLNDLISVPHAKMKIGNKEMRFQVNYNDMREELHMVNPLFGYLEVFGEYENGLREYKITFIYDSKSQVDKVYLDFKNRFLPQLGALSKYGEEMGEYIKPALSEGPSYGKNEISYVIVPESMIHVMAKHLINDDGVIMNVGDQRFGKYEYNSFMPALSSLINKSKNNR